MKLNLVIVVVKTILTTNLKRLIEEKIKIQKWSIEQVAHVVRIAYKTIYNWIDQGLLDINVTDLPDHGIRRKRAKETRGTFSHGRSIEDRPAEISDRNTSGHFEADTVLSPNFKNKLAGGVETLPRTACYLMSGSLFSLRVVLNAESGALRSQNTPGGYGSLAFSGEAR